MDDDEAVDHSTLRRKASHKPFPFTARQSVFPLKIIG
jgi:hypothetical protein